MRYAGQRGRNAAAMQPQCNMRHALVVARALCLVIGFPVVGLLPRGLKERAELLRVELAYPRDDRFPDGLPVARLWPLTAMVVQGSQGHRLELSGKGGEGEAAPMAPDDDLQFSGVVGRPVRDVVDRA